MSNASLDDFDSDNEDGKDDDSDAEYGEPIIKRPMTAKNPKKCKMQYEDGDDENIPLRQAPKFKANDFKPLK